MFDTTQYKRLLDDYKLEIENRYWEYCGFAYDGPIVADRWEDKKINKVKTLFLAKETYGYDGCGISPILDCPDGFDISKTNLQISKLAFCIKQFFSKIKRNSCKIFTDQLLFEQTDEIIDSLASIDKDLLKESYSNIAVLEVKKTSGGTKSNDAEIRKHSIENAEFLAKQIKFLSPDIIICCGNVTWQSLIIDTGLIIKKNIISNEKKAFVYNEMILYNSYHPSAPHFVMYDVLFDLFKCITDKAASNKAFAKAWS